MHVVVTAVGPDHAGLADPIIHHLTNGGANIHEIQMYDRDAERLFAMLVRFEWPADDGTVAPLRKQLGQIGAMKDLSVRVWARGERRGGGTAKPRVAICTTYRPEPALAVLQGMRDGVLKAEPAVMLGNRPACRGVAERFGVDWHHIGDAAGRPDDERMVELFDEYRVDYIVLARYMRVLPAATCWRFAGGRIVNLHHGLLPPFPGFRPYEDAHAHHMLTYGATAHFIVPELDAGNQIIHQGTFSVLPGTPLKEIKHRGETQHEPAVLLEGMKRVLDGDVALRFHRVVRVTKN